MPKRSCMILPSPPLKVPGELEQLGGDLDDIQVTRQKWLRTASIDPSCTSGWYSKITSTPWIMICYWGHTPSVYQYTQYMIYIYRFLMNILNIRNVEGGSGKSRQTQGKIILNLNPQVLLQMFEWFLGVEFLRCSFCLVYFLSMCISNCLTFIVFNLPKCFSHFFCGHQVISKLGT